MSVLLQFYLAALAYGLAAITLVWSLERLGALRDGVLAETLWRIALYAGLGIALVQTAGVAFRDRLVTALWPNNSAVAAQVDAGQRLRTAPRAESRAMAAVTPQAAANAPANRPVRYPESQRWIWSEAEAGVASLVLALALSLALIRVFIQLTRRRRFLRAALQRAHAAPGHWHRHVAALDAEQLNPDLRSAANIDSPLCGDGRVILLPDWTEALDTQAQRALLAHELAHLRRRDPQWRLLDAGVVALMCALPPFRYAARRLEALAELACDAEAARRTRSPQALAECIALCLEFQFAASPRLTVAMATPNSSVVERVQRLIEERPMFTSQRPALRRGLIALSILAAMALPVVAINVAAEQGASLHIQSSDGPFGARTVVTFNDDGRKLSLKTSGQIAFNDAESDIASISEGGSFALVETRDGVKRALSVESDAGQLSREFRIDGAVHAFDASAQQWLAAVLPDLFRRTGLDAEARARRIHARSGLDGLLAEIEWVSNDHARAEYIAAAFALDRPNAAQLTRVVALAEAIQSDYELRRTLALVLAQEGLDEPAQLLMLRTAARIESDYECAELLVEAARQIDLDGDRLSAWQQALQGIDSDYERRRVLESLLEQGAVKPEHARLAIAMAAEIGSDYEKRMVLEKAVDAGLGPTITRSEYTRVAATLDSDYERREALLKLIDDGEVDATLALDVLNAARGLGSDYETKEVLTALARVMPNDAHVIEVYRSVARSLSTHERGEAEQALDRFAEV